LSPNPALFALYYLAVCDDRNVPQHTGGECNVFNNEWVRENKQTGDPGTSSRATLFAYALLSPTTAKPKKTSSSSSHTQENSSREDTNCHLFVDFHTFPLNSRLLHCSVSLGEGTA
jgi:hypothetical protein